MRFVAGGGGSLLVFNPHVYWLSREKPRGEGGVPLGESHFYPERTNENWDGSTTLMEYQNRKMRCDRVFQSRQPGPFGPPNNEQWIAGVAAWLRKSPVQPKNERHPRSPQGRDSLAPTAATRGSGTAFRVALCQALRPSRERVPSSEITR